MARFNLNGLFNNDRFEDFFARFGGGSADHDHLNGTTGNNTLFGGAKEDTLAGMAGEKVGEAQSMAKREVKNLAKTGQQAVEDVQDEFGALEKQIKDKIREKPLTAMAGAIALGFILAVITR